MEVFPIISMPDLEVSSPGGLCCCRLVCLLLLAVQPAPQVPHPSSPHVQLAGLAIYMLALVASYVATVQEAAAWCIIVRVRAYYAYAKEGRGCKKPRPFNLVNYVTG